MSIVDNLYGKWTVIEESERYIEAGGRKRRQFLCRCECGNKAQVLRENLVTGKSKGCTDCNKGGRPKSRSSALGLLLLALIPTTVHGRSVEISHDKILDALWAVESGRTLDPPPGDGGKSIGPYQIGHAYHEDSRVPGNWNPGCNDKRYSEWVIREYMKRWCKVAWTTGDWETVARIHNGGPKGASRKSTLGYWKKVKAILEAGE